VGGRETEKGGRTTLLEQMFVEYQIPARQTHPYPIVLIHGGGLTGSYWVSTPDGREGWATWLLRQGYAVYVVDLPTAGRSANGHPGVPTAEADLGLVNYDHPGFPAAPLMSWMNDRASDAYYQFLAAEQPLREPMKGRNDLIIEAAAQQDRMDQASIAALLDRIGPSLLITHSRSGPVGWLAADARPELVKGIVAIEPHGPPFKNAGGPAGASADEIRRPWGLTYAPLTYAPATSAAAELLPLVESPAEPGRSACWMPGNKALTLPNLRQTPVLVVTSDASYHAPYDPCTVEFLRKLGVSVDFLLLSTVGLSDRSHFMMIEKGSDAVIEAIEPWIAGRNSR
jgi:pimeloyl-ACP methyl ester carboxylesterase